MFEVPGTTNWLAALLAQMPPADDTLWSWQGASGQWYAHSVYSIGTVPMFDAANYIFAAWAPAERRFRPLYIGQSGQFGFRWDTHEKKGPAIGLGATHVLVHLLGKSKQERLDIESDLRRAWPTPLNEQGLGLGVAYATLGFGGFNP